MTLNDLEESLQRADVLARHMAIVLSRSCLVSSKSREVLGAF